MTLVSRDRTGAERRRIREGAAQTSARSQAASFFLFGLPRDETVLRAEVRWPYSMTQVVPSVPRNGRLEVKAASPEEYPSGHRSD